MFFVWKNSVENDICMILKPTGVAWEMRESKYMTAWECCGSKFVTAWKRCGFYYSCMKNARFEAL